MVLCTVTMMVRYQSRQYSLVKNKGDIQLVCGAPVLPLSSKATTTGPAPIVNQDFDDIIDEAIEVFRVVCLFKTKFDIDSPADKVLVYVTLWIHKCLQVLHCEEKSSAELPETLYECASYDLSLPGEADFPLNHLFSAAKDQRERNLCQAYLKQLRQETAKRISPLLYDKCGLQVKWWTQYANAQFMNMSL